MEVSNTKLHIEERPDGLNIYVPRNQQDQEICYLRLLPTKLFNETMMGNTGSNSTLARDSSAVAIISSIFASSDNVIGLILEEAGIVPVPYPDTYDEEAPQHPAPRDIAEDVLPRRETEPQNEEETETASLGSETPRELATPEATTPSFRSASFSSTAASTHTVSYRAGSLAHSARPPSSTSGKRTVAFRIWQWP